MIKGNLRGLFSPSIKDWVTFLNYKFTNKFAKVKYI